MLRARRARRVAFTGEVRRLTSRKLVATGAIFLAIAGVAYAAVSGIPDKAGVFHGCVSKRNGALRVVRSSKACKPGTTGHPGEFAIAWNQQGRPGPRGAQGKQGIPGPGAQTFDTTLAQGTVEGTLATAGNGLTVSGTCTTGPDRVAVQIRSTANSSSNNVQLSGTSNAGSTLRAIDSNGPGTKYVESPITADFDVVGRDSTIGGKFARMDVHGLFGAPCEFWGMIIPAS